MKTFGSIVALLVICGIVYYLWENILYSIIAFIVIGLFIQSGEWLFDHCKLQTRGFFANTGITGHSSIIDDDVLDLLCTYDKNAKFKCYRPGGSSVYWLPFHGIGDIYIIKDNLVEEADGAVIAKADYHKCQSFDEIPKT